MTDRNRKSPAAISRRRFVGLLAASSAALLARSASAEDPMAAQPADETPVPAKPAAKKPAPKPVAATLTPAQKEFDRQRASTLATAKTIREFPLSPGGELGVTFRPMRAARRGR